MTNINALPSVTQLLKLLLWMVLFLVGIEHSKAAGSTGIPYDNNAIHMGLVYGASSEQAVTSFYGEVLGLQRIPDVTMPDNGLLVQYRVGDSDLSFIIFPTARPEFEGGVDAAYGIRMVALLFPQKKKSSILQRLRDSGREIPTFTSGKAAKGYSFEFGMVYDNDGNQIELVFLDEKTPPEKFRQIQIALSVSDLKSTQYFMRDVLQLSPSVDQGSLHRYQLGLTQIKYMQKKPGLPTWVGTPEKKIGMMMIQFAVEDINAVVELMELHNVTIDRGPFIAREKASLLFVDGPDGIKFQFIERKRL